MVQRRLAQRVRELRVVHGAGLDDFWKYMGEKPHAAGGFLWVWADEAVEAYWLHNVAACPCRK